MDIQRKNTLAFLSNYTDKVVEKTKLEILRKRKRQYGTRTLNTPIESSGEGRKSIHKVSDTDGFNVVGNDYLEDVDEGTQSTKATLSEIIAWMKKKPVLVTNSKGKVIKQSSERRDAVARIIQRKLVFEGIKRTAFLTDLVDRSIVMLNGIENAVADDVVADMGKILEAHGFVEKGEKYILDIKR